MYKWALAVEVNEESRHQVNDGGLAYDALACLRKVMLAGKTRESDDEKGWKQKLQGHQRLRLW